VEALQHTWEEGHATCKKLLAEQEATLHGRNATAAREAAAKARSDRAAAKEAERAAKEAGLEERFELIHIPKNAGTALEEAGHAAGFLWGSYKWDELCNHEWCADKDLGCSMWHVPRGYLREHPGDTPDTLQLPEGVDPYDNSKTICVVRHPFTRAISQYIYWSVLNEGGCYNATKLDECSSSSFANICKPELLNTYINQRFNGRCAASRPLYRPPHVA